MRAPLLAVLSLLVPLVRCSAGNNLAAFRDCVGACIAEHCGDAAAPALHLRLLLWSCPAECDYSCQHAVSRQLVARGAPLEQFHGKWPFHRIMGIQEPFSVLFSLGNGLVHYHGLRLLSALPHGYPLRPFYLLLALFGINAWVWSCVFHSRDFPFTERMDYFSAGAYMLYSLFYAPLRLFRLYRSPRSVRIWALSCVLAYLLHIGYLSFVIFDYKYNMTANIAVAILQNTVWLLYSLVHARTSPSWALWPAMIVLGLTCSTMLEIFDFPPWRYAIDAHSLWHASTIPFTYWWYHFLWYDSQWEIAQKRHPDKLKVSS